MMNARQQKLSEMQEERNGITHLYGTVPSYVFPIMIVSDEKIILTELPIHG